MASLTAQDMASRTMKKGWAKREDAAEEDDPGVLEKISRAMHGGRTRAQRALYNSTRAGLFNSDTSPEEPGAYGGLGIGLKARRALDGYDAQDISDKVPRRKSPLYDKSDDSKED